MHKLQHRVTQFSGFNHILLINLPNINIYRCSVLLSLWKMKKLWAENELNFQKFSKYFKQETSCNTHPRQYVQGAELQEFSEALGNSKLLQVRFSSWIICPCGYDYRGRWENKIISEYGPTQVSQLCFFLKTRD